MATDRWWSEENGGFGSGLLIEILRKWRLGALFIGALFIDVVQVFL